jgi:8-oxo-dGTP pyrophosphatase MutT (NUDIX family)
MTFEETVARLDRAFTRPLPGHAAQLTMSPRPRRQWPAGFNRARIRNAAGLLLVAPGAPRRTAHIVLTVRSDNLGRHSGQVSLPGGVVDPGETFEETALREAQEEIGLVRNGIRILGALTPLDIPVSGFELHPIVGALGEPPQLRAADAEVAAILRVPIATLTNPENVTTIERTRDGTPFVVPAFQVPGGEIWGATAMVLAEFLALLNAAD